MDNRRADPRRGREAPRVGHIHGSELHGGRSYVREVGLAILVVACGCSSRVEVRSADGDSSAVSIAGASYATSGIRDYSSAVSSCLDDATSASGWQRFQMSEAGPARWCTGRGSRVGCSLDPQWDWERDQRGVQLRLLTDERLRVSGLIIEAMSVPEDAGWGARLVYGDPLRLGAYELTFNLFAHGRNAPISTLPLGSTLAWPVRWEGETVETFRVDVAGTGREQLARVAGSPDALRDQFGSAASALREKVHAGLAGLGAKKPVCPSRGRYTMAQCRFELFTERDQAWLAATADKEIGRWMEVLEGQAPALRAALLWAYPLDRCWP